MHTKALRSVVPVWSASCYPLSTRYDTHRSIFITELTIQEIIEDVEPSRRLSKLGSKREATITLWEGVT
jgi:hypothetical protein